MNSSKNKIAYSKRPIEFLTKYKNISYMFLQKKYNDFRPKKFCNIASAKLNSFFYIHFSILVNLITFVFNFINQKYLFNN